MNRFLQIFNFLGVIALTWLCCAQWRTNGDLNRQVSDLERQRIDLTAQLAQRDKRIKEDAADLDDFRARLTMAEGQLRDQQIKLNAAISENERLAAERKQLLGQRDQLTAALESWKAAVAAREEALKKAAEEVATLVAQRNEAVQKFNDLANKFNAVVDQLNSERARMKNAASQPSSEK